MKKLGILIVTLIVAASVSIAIARPGGKSMDGDMEGRGGRGGAMFERLDLTDDQAEEIKALNEAMKEETEPLREDIAEKREKLKTLWEADDPAADKIKEVQSEINDLHNQMSDKVTDHRIKIGEILTPEQREELGKRGMDGKGRGGKGPGGKKGDRPPKDRESRELKEI